jgi:7-cyano-7-deazaguanine synthase
MLVMVSGGADSATLLYQYRNVQLARAIAFDYGQKHRKELEHAKLLCERTGTPLDIVTVHSFLSEPGLNNVFPARNLVFLSVATAYAIRYDLRSVGFAATKDDFDTFPDCRREFVDAARKVMELSGDRPVTLIAPYLELTRKQVVKIGRSCNVPYEDTWSCYEGGEQPCGSCRPCVSRKEAGI